MRIVRLLSLVLIALSAAPFAFALNLCPKEESLLHQAEGKVTQATIRFATSTSRVTRQSMALKRIEDFSKVKGARLVESLNQIEVEIARLSKGCLKKVKNACRDFEAASALKFSSAERISAMAQRRSRRLDLQRHILATATQRNSLAQVLLGQAKSARDLAKVALSSCQAH